MHQVRCNTSSYVLHRAWFYLYLLARYGFPLFLHYNPQQWCIIRDGRPTSFFLIYPFIIAHAHRFGPFGTALDDGGVCTITALRYVGLFDYCA